MESKLQRKIIQDLELDGWEVNKVMKSNKAGWPDLEAFRNKITIFIETKSRGKKAKPIQEYVHRRLRAQGFSVFVIDTWDAYLSARIVWSKGVC
jgi:Holliday junction resolvase